MDRDLWLQFQHLDLGSALQPLQLSTDTRQRQANENRLSLVVRGLNPTQQNLTWMRNTLPRAWRLHDRVRGQLNDDGTIRFIFDAEHHLLSVIERGPWSFKDWMVVMDPWYRRLYPNYLQTISFWIQIFNLPDEYRNQRVVEDISRRMGQYEGSRLVEPTRDSPSEVWVRVKFNAYEPFYFVRHVQLEEGGPPVLLRFEYQRLKKFCSTCGRLTHDEANCPLAPIPELEPPQEQPDVNQDIDQQVEGQELHEPQQDLNEYDEPIEEIHTTEYFHDVVPPLLNHIRVQPAVTLFGQPGAIVEAGSTSGQESGTKRKAEDPPIDEASPSHRQRISEETDATGLVVALKPPEEP
ncbi:hypothetical protein EUTSA_v10003380mg [Eutrema salsugineum]|uniref:DUF4283 domain-containing protein n=1 Tax=Eutrema salsugineum TaxID=72664 RepID=V4NFD0_EUTSA|nr:uncharacterized protein At4g02000 [Eutrema salsugineum]ESQ44831.1 hypothetical protein EUTSA_v10003380mg [Eutrema salsugineum]